jgi:protein TonB
MKLRISWPLGRLFGTLMAAVLAVALLPACSDEPQRERRMQMVKLLPDAPPPPPPPPPKEKPPEPPKSDKPPPDSKQPEAEPSNQLKSDEAAGDGPGNGLVAGTVTQDYTDQKAAPAGRIDGGGDDAAARLAAQSFAASTTRALNDFLAREQPLKRGDYRAQVDIWLTPSGSVQRAELQGSTGDLELDRALRESLLRFPGTAAPPDGLRQPLRLRVTNRMLG